ncbi:MAG: single-stranded-DNA-specific exonuclease RecJ, partial [Cyanobacteria bacterium]|nr:single-stranded-DNA-specific exonuclease RecJ [Cyanobacteriota bacterium]MDW8203263.1 single-stranded-DNA-specific exonuclease RecJ [Cyanobacteriota bacterium SKYGB_h_bin112]
STALLIRALRFLGAKVDYAIPSRMTEGYGLNQRIVEEFYQEGVRLILTVDNGIAAVEPIARAKELGLRVIVTDHHDIPEKLPPADAILNPKLIAEESPYRGLAGVGVAYVLALSLAKAMGQTQVLSQPLLELFTLGTIADLAPLTGVNRRWVRRGLCLLARSQLPGVQALIQISGVGNAQPLKPEAIGFGLGPRINAVGRLGDPQLVIELLTTDDAGLALERAMQCEQINQERQRLCREIEQEAIALYEASVADLHADRVLTLVKEGWHHGVIGIVASRLVERYGAPVFIATYEDDEHRVIRGSARSIPEFHVFAALEYCSDLLTKFGGHRAAGGFSLQAENWSALQSRLSEFAHQSLQPDHLKPLVAVDVQADLAQITRDLYDQLDTLHPCGIGNPDPVFWTPNVRIISQQPMGKDRSHLRVTLVQDVVQDASPSASDRPASSHPQPNTPRSMRALAWNWGGYYPLPERVDVAYQLRLNDWDGETSVELELVGVRLPSQLPASPPVAFTYEDRNYTAMLVALDSDRELRIKNAQGHELVVKQGQKTALLFE